MAESSAIVTRVHAAAQWVETTVIVDVGDTLLCVAEGNWVDAIVRCSADGYHAPLFYAINRPPRIPDGDVYFRLMGRIMSEGTQPLNDEPSETFPIGTKANVLAGRSGSLFVFANDRLGYYWNNWGSVLLSITRQTQVRC